MIDDYKELQRRAHQITHRAIKRGELVRADNCELCNSPNNKTELGRNYRGEPTVYHSRNRLVPHHYNGYDGDNALKVWWVCQSCNHRLAGCHDGSLTKDQARELVLSAKRKQGAA